MGSMNKVTFLAFPGHDCAAEVERKSERIVIFVDGERTFLDIVEITGEGTSCFSTESALNQQESVKAEAAKTRLAFVEGELSQT